MKEEKYFIKNKIKPYTTNKFFILREDEYVKCIIKFLGKSNITSKKYFTVLGFEPSIVRTCLDEDIILSKINLKNKNFLVFQLFAEKLKIETLSSTELKIFSKSVL